MSKIFIIAQREFLSRVQKKTFLLTTILLPVIIFVFYGFIIYFSVKSNDNLKIVVVDEAPILKEKFSDKKDIAFEWKGATPVAELKKMLTDKKADAYVLLPKTVDANDTIQLVSGKTLGLMTREKIQRIFSNALEEQRMLAMNINKTTLDSLQQQNEIKFISADGKEDDDLKAGVSYGVGYLSGFLIYIVLFIYGSMVMRGVMEEKMNRIAEVIVSSVKPFELMMGKILGIGGVGLLQFIIWMLLGIGLNLLLPLIFPSMSGEIQAGMQTNMQPGMTAAVQQVKPEGVAKLMHGLQSINFSLIIGCFIFYFIGGYLLYSALFAAVGSAVNEDPQDAQSLLLPITMPIIFGIVIMTKAVNDPSSSLAVFGSLFPLTSPIVMMGRIAHGVPDGVPYWQLITSMLLLIGGFICTTWIAGKIYRTGILMYGKKPTWKELMKWAFTKA